MKRHGIVIVDYGMANLRSVQKAFEACGHRAEITSDANRIAESAKVVLPGVGAFQDAIGRLRETALADAITTHLREGHQFLGICLGMQMLFSKSHEDGVHAGLNWFPGDVVRFPRIPGLKVPHMGWNTLRLTKPGCPLFRDLPTNPSVYFVHGYYPQPTRDVTAATADYPDPFTAVVWQDNVMATQFHPEKSQKIGLQMLRNFAEV
jgi:imidazole glycerol-phosphate synthase subunit HisH